MRLVQTLRAASRRGVGVAVIAGGVIAALASPALALTDAQKNLLNIIMDLNITADKCAGYVVDKKKLESLTAGIMQKEGFDISYESPEKKYLAERRDFMYKMGKENGIDAVCAVEYNDFGPEGKFKEYKLMKRK